MKTIHTHHQQISVPLSYPVHFLRDVFNPGCGVLETVLSDPERSGPIRVMAVVDKGVSHACPAWTQQLQTWFQSRPDQVDLVCDPVILPGGEAIKNDYRILMRLVDQMLEYHLCRHSVVLVVGGGAMLDAVGFAASLVHRGVRLVRMPSTTLAQNDAGLGVKNGMNLHGGKNTVGVFTAPWAVVNDFALLDGLEDDVWRAGISEAFKVAMIKDAEFFKELLDLAPALGQRDATAMERVIIRCAELHLNHIATSGDPFEQGTARPLDFGHWSAHKLESMSGYRISHGHAVAVGITIDARIAARMRWIDSSEADALEKALKICGFNLAPPELDQRLGDGQLQILQGLGEFREHLGGELTLAMPGPVGRVRDLHEVDGSWVEAQVDHLRSSTACG